MTNQNSFAKRLPTPKAAEYVGLGKGTLDKLRLSGGGPVFIRHGRRVVYDIVDLDKWCDARKRTSTSASAPLAA